MTPLDRAVLALMLDRYPALLSIEEVARFMLADVEDFAERDAVENSIRALAQRGLVHRIDRFVFASFAAVSADVAGV